MAEFNRQQRIKRRFFAMRNGVVADMLRRGGSPFRIIFGLNLPQLADIASETGHDMELADELWANTSTRESMLLAPMLIDPADVDIDRGVDMICASPSVEVTDVLCHKLLRHCLGAMEMARRAQASQSELASYGAVRLALNVLRQWPAEACALADGILADVTSGQATRRVALQLKDEADFLGL